MARRPYRQRLAELSARLVDAQRPIRVLDAIDWDEAIEAQVVASDFTRLPEVDADYYQRRRPLPYDARDKIAEFAAIRRDVTDQLGAADELGAILARNCAEYQDVVRLLEARGTPAFYEYSRALYGSAREHFVDERTTVNELGNVLDEVLSIIDDRHLGATYPRQLSAERIVQELNERFAAYFADHQVHARLDDGIVSDAAAGADYVKVRRGALFSERDRDLLEVHEGWVHIATTLNGMRQRHARWLGKGPPCCTPVQEGLAVLMEIFTFNMTPDRARKINNRILACAMAEDGADFLQVCAFYRAKGYTDRECFQHARRIFRGGVVTGGAPFTKDIAYGKGFVMIYNFLRTAIRYGRPEVIPFLFAGKLTLEDVPVLWRHHRAGVIDAPHYLPPQFRDLNGLAVWLAYSNFFNRTDLKRVQEHYRALLAEDGPA